MVDGNGLLKTVVPRNGYREFESLWLRQSKVNNILGEFLRCPVHIPPQYIKLLKLTNQDSE